MKKYCITNTTTFAANTLVTSRNKLNPKVYNMCLKAAFLGLFLNWPIFELVDSGILTKKHPQNNGEECGHFKT